MGPHILSPTNERRLCRGFLTPPEPEMGPLPLQLTSRGRGTYTMHRMCFTLQRPLECCTTDGLSGPHETANGDDPTKNVLDVVSRPCALDPLLQRDPVCLHNLSRRSAVGAGPATYYNHVFPLHLLHISHLPCSPACRRWQVDVAWVTNERACMSALVVNVYNVKIERRHGRQKRIRPTYAGRI